MDIKKVNNALGYVVVFWLACFIGLAFSLLKPSPISPYLGTISILLIAISFFVHAVSIGVAGGIWKREI